METIHFKLFGSFSCIQLDGSRQLGEVHEVLLRTGKKTQSFLQYLIVNHNRNVSSEELIDTFWAEQNSRNPSNALRYMLHKIRTLLKNMFPNQEELLQTLQGCYAWDPKIVIELDSEQFEKICIRARSSPKEESIELLKQALSLYKGDFLSGNDNEWARVPRQYYRTLYLDVCQALLSLLEEKEEWMEIVSICSQAYQIDFCMEDFTAYQMQAFIAMGQPKQALERYELLKDRMLNELGISPTDRMEKIHMLAQSLCRKEIGDGQDIFRLVCRGNSSNQAFFCSFEIFQNIVALEQRHIERSKETSVLVIISLDSGEALTTDARRLENILREELKSGDPVARITAGSYIIMLTGTDMHNAHIVISRLDIAFHKTYRHSNAKLSFRMAPLELEQERIKNTFFGKITHS